MTLDEYEKLHRPLYAEFAAIVRNILEHTIREANLSSPQSVQCRAKTVSSLKARLAEKGQELVADIEHLRRDLAGVRLVFYTNNDVNAFVNSGILHGNFEIEKDGLKIHYPTEDNDRTRYQAIHYTVRLTSERLNLTEYKRFQNMRCEIQIQTILNHAWSETTHDILYKSNQSDGFGSTAMRKLQNRINKIMDEYLLPAGYEFQRVQYDYERLKKGKILFDRDAISSLTLAADNNERHEILRTLKDYTLPNYDDLPAIYQELKGPLLEVVAAARAAPIVTMSTPFGELPGHNASRVVQVVVELFEFMRYMDATATLSSMVSIYRDETDPHVRTQILQVVKRLSEYNVAVWNQIGPGIQHLLTTYLSELTPAEIDDALDLVLVVWGEALKSELSGTSVKGDTITITSGAVSPSIHIGEIRDSAIDGLFAALDRVSDGKMKEKILNVLTGAFYLPTMVEYQDELAVLTIQNTSRIVESVIERIPFLSFDILQNLEERFLLEYQRCTGFKMGEAKHSAIGRAAELLKVQIIKFRDIVNQDKLFIRYKVLVGFKSVFEEDWEGERERYQEKENFRRQQAALYVDEIDAASQEEWLKFIDRCAATESDDMATFPTFSKFLIELSRRKPEIAECFVAHGSFALLGFLAAFLEGLASSGNENIYNRVLDREISNNNHLWGLVRHWRFFKPNASAKLQKILCLAMDKKDLASIGECVLFALEHAGTELVPDPEHFLRPALNLLISLRNANWVNGCQFPPTGAFKFSALEDRDISLALENVALCPRIQFAQEKLLEQVAKHDLEAVWNFFGQRINRDREGGSLSDFEVTPYSFHALQHVLSSNPQLAVEKAIVWYGEDSDLFQYRGGRLLSRVFPLCTEAFSDSLSKLVLEGDLEEAQCVLQILINYQGDSSVQTVLKDLVFRHHETEKIIMGVKRAFDNTGAVWGQYGIVEALKKKREEMTKWLLDDREHVREFASTHIAELDVRITSEQRQADQEAQMRRYAQDNDDDG